MRAPALSLVEAVYYLAQLKIWLFSASWSNFLKNSALLSSVFTWFFCITHKIYLNSKS
jgi:hypothetical protein